MSGLPITAAWSTRRVIPTRLVRNWCGGGLGVALIFLGAGDFGVVNTQRLAPNVVGIGDQLTKYGRGLSTFATLGPPLTPAVFGNYGSATFRVDTVCPGGTCGTHGSVTCPGPGRTCYTLQIN